VGEIGDRRETLIMYEAPHRLLESLAYLLEALGNREMAVCRELTKLHEEIFRGKISEAAEHFGSKQIKGEIVLVIRGKSEEEIRQEKKAEWESLTIEEHIISYMNQGRSKKESIKQVSSDRNMPKSEVYKYSTEIE